MKKSTGVTILLIILIITVTFTLTVPSAKATDVEIISVLPPILHGKVGEEVRVTGTINTTDGLYLIWLDNINVVNGTAEQNKADITFQIPYLPGGNKTLTLQDDTTKNNATTWFYIDTAYYIESRLPEEPKQLEEGDSVVLNVTITGGLPNKVYCANVTVKLPDPLNDTFSGVVELANTTNIGYGNATVVYPNETLFEPSGSHTNYTGSYRVYFNRTYTIAETEFFIGLTNSSEYHREDLVEIKAVGYQPNETATITITYPNTNATLHSEQINASLEGIISFMEPWPIPNNASIGTYNITISSTVTTKTVADSQLFNIPGYPIEVYTRNLAEDAIPQILVEALDQAANTTFENASETNGLARLQLEKGNHTLTAFWKKVKVGEICNLTITGKDTYNLTCELVKVRIAVMDKDDILIPFVNLNISYQYVTTNEGELENESETAETDISGTFFFNPALPHINYTINASRYEIVFNANNDTIENLPAEPRFNITIICPSKTLALNILEYHRNPFPNARVEMIEQSGGLSYSEVTNDSGITTIQCTIGKYDLRVYKDDVLLNETFVEMFNDTYCQIYCQLYNLTVSAKIVDYFGQPISDANVVLQREGLAPRSILTKSDGTAIFLEVIGGSIQISVYMPGQTQPCIATTFFIDKPTTINIKLEKYVILANYTVETSQLATLIIIIATLVLILFIEVYRRKRLKPQKSKS